MSRTNKARTSSPPAAECALAAGRVPQLRKANHLKDEVYREMLRLEANRPGAEMALALALLRAMVQSESLSARHEFADWLRAICPVGLRMIEAALGEESICGTDSRVNARL